MPAVHAPLLAPAVTPPTAAVSHSAAAVAEQSAAVSPLAAAGWVHGTTQQLILLARVSSQRPRTLC
jgi:hypothetical protein